MMAVPELTIAIGSYLETEQVERIAAQSAVRVLYEPELLPVPRYPSDHTGVRRQLTDAELEKWRARPIGETPYLILDARYEKVRHGGQVRSCAVLVAIGVHVLRLEENSRT